MKNLVASVTFGLLVCSTAAYGSQPLHATSARPAQTSSITVVEVPGERDCSGILSEGCGWGSAGTGTPESGGPGAGTGGGGGGSGNYDDGTRGKAMGNNRFNPGCKEEALFMEQTLSQIYTSGNPVGTYVPLEDFRDPLYSNGEWQKFQAETILSGWREGNANTMQRRIQIHYMFHMSTRTVQQVKFKNSYEYGCKGITK